MAITAAAVGEVRAATGNDNWGGFFIAGASGTDRSQANAPFVAINNSTITTSVTMNVITFTGGYTPTAADIGNVVQIVSGTNTTAGSFFNITAQTSTTWTVNGNVVSSGTTTNMVANMGGALATLGKVAGAMPASTKSYCVGAGVNAFTSSATITFEQPVSTTSAAPPPTRLIGYGSSRGDTTHAALTLQTNTGLVGLKSTGQSFYFEQMDVDCTNLGTSTGITVGTSGLAIRCMVKNYTTAGITVGSSGHATECEVTSGSGASGGITGSGITTTLITRCFVHDNTGPGIIVQSGTAAYNIVANNSGANSDGIEFANNAVILNNTIHNNGRDGIHNNGTTQLPMTIRNNILSANGGFGFTADASAALPASYQYDGNAYFSNTSGARNNADS